MTAPYPWLEPTWQRLCTLYREKRLPHGLLLSGPAGVGKRELGLAFARYIACRNAQEFAACGECGSCRQFDAGSFPDFHEVTLLEDEKTGKLKKQISVGQIRDLTTEVGMMSQQGGWKTVLLHPADAMNVNAANSLLKTLEEPPPRSLLLLVSSRPASLLPTIRSRCQQLSIPAPAAAAGEEWLKEQGVSLPAAALAQAGGAPVRALELAEGDFLKQRATLFKSLVDLHHGARSVPNVAAEFDKIGARMALPWLESLLEDVIRFRQGGAEMSRWRNPDIVKSLKSLAEGLNLRSMHRYLEAVRVAVRLEERANVAPLLLIEGLLVAWARRLDETTLDTLLEG